MVGYPLYAIAAYRWAGLSSSGDPQGFLNGHISTDYNSISILSADSGIAAEGSVVYVGPASPVYFGSFINEFSWKGFFASVNISYKMGYYFRKPAFTSGSLIEAGYAPAEYTKRWQQPGDELKTNVPALVYTDYPQFSSRDEFYLYSEVNVQKADNIRLQYVNLGYTFSGKIGHFPMEQLQIYLNARPTLGDFVEGEQGRIGS